MLTGPNDHAILVPQQCVSRDVKGNPIVMVVDAKNTVQQKSVVVDRAIGNRWLISSGLEEGEQVIAEGALKTRVGGEVKTIPYVEQKGDASHKIK